MKMVLTLSPGMEMVEDKAFSWLVILCQDKVMALLISYKVQIMVEGECLIYLLIAFEEEEGLLAVFPSSIVMEEGEHLMAVTPFPVEMEEGEDLLVVPPPIVMAEREV